MELEENAGKKRGGSGTYLCQALSFVERCPSQYSHHKYHDPSRSLLLNI